MGSKFEKNTITETKWKSIWIANIVAFIGAVQSSCLVPTVWPYLKRVDVTASENLYGVIRSLFALGLTIFSVLSGYLSNKLEDTGPALIVGKLLVVVAVVFYCLIGVVPAAYVLMFAIFEIVFGVATGCASVFRTHIAMASTDADRVKAYGATQLCCAIGLIVGPILQISLSKIAYPGFQILPDFYLNMFTAPGWLAAAISVVGIVLLIFCFDGKMNVSHPGKASKNEAELCLAKELDNPEVDVTVAMIEATDLIVDTITEFDGGLENIPYNYHGIGILIFAKVVGELIMLNMSTILPPYMMTVFQWSSEQAVVIQSILMGTMGFLIILTSASFVFFKLGRVISERFALCLGFSCYFMFHLFTYPWGFYGDSIEYLHEKGSPGYSDLASALSNQTLQRLINESMLPNSNIEIVGCNLRYQWCETTPKISFPLFAVCCLITTGIAMPLTTINLDTLYSKVLGPIKQGTLQGVFIGSSQVIGIFGPVLFSLLYTNFGPKIVWLIELAFCGTLLALMVIFYSKLVSWDGQKSNSRNKFEPLKQK